MLKKFLTDVKETILYYSFYTIATVKRYYYNACITIDIVKRSRVMAKKHGDMGTLNYIVSATRARLIDDEAGNFKFNDEL